MGLIWIAKTLVAKEALDACLWFEPVVHPIALLGYEALMQDVGGKAHRGDGERECVHE